METREYLNSADGLAEIINLKQGFIEKRLAMIESIKEDEKNLQKYTVNILYQKYNNLHI